MAKGLRASSRKKNNAALRAKVFAPVVDARTERLSAKLQELAAKPKPEREKIMEVEELQKEERPSNGDPSDEMDVDAQGAKMKPIRTTSNKKNKSGRIEKKIAKRKPRNVVVFPPIRSKERRLAAGKQKRG